MSNQTTNTEQTVLRRWGGFLVGGIVIILSGFALLVALEVLFDPSPLLLGVCAIAIILAVNLWGRQYGITTIFGR